MVMESPVRFYPTDDRRLEKRLSDKLLKVRADTVTNIGDGCALDWAHYKNLVGYIEGLTHAIELCKETEKELSER